MEQWSVALDILVLLAIVALAFFIKSYLPAYMNEKAKNLATKEDIEDITRKVEETKLIYSKDLKEFEARLNSAAQSKKLCLDKLEELITAVSGFRTWLEKETNFRILLTAQAGGDSLIHRAELLTTLYFPEFETEMETLRKAHLQAVVWLAKAKNELSAAAGDQKRQEQILERLVTDQSEFFSHQRALGDATINFERKGREVLEKILAM